MNLLIPVFSGFTLGCIHAFDMDHVAAVTAFVSKDPRPDKAVRFGILWGIGHTATLLLLGVAAVALRFVIPSLVESVAEIAVGMLLVFIGGWTLNEVFHRKQIHVHRHAHDGIDHTHLHSHGESQEHRHQHTLFFIGATHGIAGTASVMVIIPMALTHSVLTAVLYLVTFGFGTIVAMSMFAYVLGKFTRSLSTDRSLVWFRALAGAASVCIGCLWIGGRLL